MHIEMVKQCEDDAAAHDGKIARIPLAATSIKPEKPLTSAIPRILQGKEVQPA